MIESLAEDEDARRHFLRCCGVDGVALALSWRGTQRPLLRGDADWDALGDGLHHLCPELDEATAVQLLALFEDAGEFDEVLALARLALDRLGWAGKAISVDAIAAWAPVAARLDPPPAPPAVAMTWLELDPAEAPRDPVELERFADWVRLASILFTHDPALLGGLGFPDRYEQVLLDFADQQGLDEPPVERDLRVETLDRLASMDPVLAPRAGATAVTLRVEELAPIEVLVDEPLPVDGFPVERVLRDL